MTEQPLEVHFKVWLERGGQVALSDWRVQLLEEIDRHSSLTEAARQLGVPYKTAWYKLKEMEKSLGASLVSTSSGGPKGGGAVLTEAGKEAVRQYHRLASGLDELLAARFNEGFGPCPSERSEESWTG